MRYRIKHHAEEFECPRCGCPCYVHDTAWMGDRPYCSAYCAGADPTKQQTPAQRRWQAEQDAIARSQADAAIHAALGYPDGADNVSGRECSDAAW